MPEPDQRPRVLLIASKLGYQTRVFEEAAARLGVDLIYATDRCGSMDNPWGDNAVPLKFHKPEVSIRALTRYVQPPPDGIVAVGDKPAYIAALAAERFGLAFSPAEAVAAAGNKHEARRRFAAAGLTVPRFFRVALTADPDEAARRAPYPCVLKPLELSASRGVIRANTPDEFLDAFARIRMLLEAHDVRRLGSEDSRYLQVEQFIPGKEFAVEGILTHGRLQIHAIFDKPDDLNGPFFEESIYVTPSRECEATQRLIVAATERAVFALGLDHGPVHAEMRVNAEGVWMLEVAARPIGGLCAKSLRFAGGVTLEELILGHATGEDVSHLVREMRASGVMMIPIPKNGVYHGVSGVEEAAATPCITEVAITATEGQRMLKLPEGASYLGFIFGAGETAAQVESALREAHARLRFEIATDLPVFGPQIGALLSESAQ